MSLRLPHQPLQPFNVLAFDPGGTTGWAWAILPVIPETVELTDIEIRTGEFGPREHHMDLEEWIRFASYISEDGNVPQVEIVFEPFHYRQNVVGEGEKFRGKVELISAEYIGVIKLACAHLGLTYYDRFTPGEAKRWTTDLKLQKLGWFQTPAHPKRHQNDALRQLVKYLIVKKGVRHPLTTAWRI